MKVFGKVVNILLVLILIITSYTIVDAKIKNLPPTIFGHQVYYVLSGSMEPTIKTGSIILVKKRTNLTKIKTGEIITFKMPYNEQILVTHRIIETLKNNEQLFYITKGDANLVKDPWIIDKNSIVSVYSGVTIPFIGYIYKEIHSSFITYFLLISLGLVLLSYGIRLFKK